MKSAQDHFRIGHRELIDRQPESGDAAWFEAAIHEREKFLRIKID